MCVLVGDTEQHAEVAVGGANATIWTFNGRRASDTPTLHSEAHAHGVTGVARHPTNPSLFVTVGVADQRLVVWDCDRHCLVQRTKLPAPGHCVDYRGDGESIAVGLANGAFVILEASTLRREVKQQEAQRAVTQIRYSPDGYSLAVASRDGFIDLYDATRAYRRTARCAGHSNAVLHLDWSSDSTVLQSNCAGYEILYWIADTGRQIRSSVDTVEADTDWATWTCVLGFPVMGVWPAQSTNADVNAVDRSGDRAFVVTADNFGDVKLFNWPCVAEQAPHYCAPGHSNSVGKALGAGGCLLLAVIRVRFVRWAQTRACTRDARDARNACNTRCHSRLR
jgi:WD40 repeat protein